MSYKYNPPTTLSRRERRYQSLRETLLHSRRPVPLDSTDALDIVLQTHFPRVSSVFELEHIPESGGDFYYFIIDSTQTATILIPYPHDIEGEIIVEIEPIDERRRRHAGNSEPLLKMALEFLQYEEHDGSTDEIQ